MGVTGLFGAGLASQDGDERRVALGELFKAGEDVADFFKAMQAFGAIAELAGGLRAAQEQDADQSGFRAGKVEGFAQPVLVFGDAAIGGARSAGEALVFKAAQGKANFLFIKM